MKVVKNLAGMIPDNKSPEKKQAIFRALETVVDSVGDAFGSNCEVVLHDLRVLSHSIVKIVNGHVTERKIGSPITDFGLEILERSKSSGKDIVSGYFNELENGKLMKSSSCIIRDIKGKPIYMICINIDLSVPFLDFVRDYFPNGSDKNGRSVEHFPLAMNDLVNRTLETVINQISGQTEILPSEKNKAIILELYKKGFFRIRGAIDIAAKKMGISRYTVYNYIREAKVEAEEA